MIPIIPTVFNLFILLVMAALVSLEFAYSLMDSFFSHGNDKHFSEPCECFVAGDGVYHRMSKREKHKLGIG